ncbi:PREDICTED: acyl-CoA synthetase short-chain family member 3, mitochondrial-like [Priapulus caudatus]|uniref:acetate--CoA ligase n=1 Tax=Priapulus caudatus TaxID=37621 RepID=A0ABM1EMN0_PRICU|nr:PREDICTED: acyl-CoA synthetase short-chain family member 3, mitochondrial-like [Priapulus caudatus]
MSRADDVINVAGHRISGGSLEEAILEHNDLVECAVLGVPDELKGTVPLGLLVLKHGVEESEGYSEEKVVNEVIQVVRGRIGPVAAFKLAVVVPKLPKTRSGKIARSTVVALAESKPFKIPVTIEDASVYPAIRDALQRIGYAQDAVIPEV